MKTLILAVLFCSSAFISFSQDLQFESGRSKNDSKPKLFAELTEKFALTSTFIDEVMSYQLKQPVEVTVNPKLIFKGRVTAINNDAPGLTTISIQSSEKQGLILSLSKLVLPDQTVVYRGIILSNSNSDLLMLDRDAATGNYVWIKKQVSQLIAD
ncbi:MAG: hypothetical protein K2Q24_10655 [Chitinophagaceae bacterium]|nr:hypothetical protein [Chitinophagaceae bacterium]